MSKAGKKKRKPVQRSGSRFADHNISMIHQHQKVGSTLIPPLAQIPGMTTSSWSDDHMPEMLWAVLLAGTLERRQYLNCFRKIAVLCREWFKRDDDESEGSEPERDPDAGLNFTIVVDHTKLSEVDDDKFHNFISVPLENPLGYAALRPLLLLESVPGIDRWRREMGVEPIPDDWNTLAHAVARVLDHQSEASTDIRWFKVIVPAISGRTLFPPEATEYIEELRLFPDRGDMREVRPSIRATELAARRNPPTSWPKAFWSQTLRDTGCVDPSEGQGYAFIDTSINLDSLYAARDEVIARFRANIKAERVDPQLDSAFGLVLYALSIVEEVGMHRVHTRMLGVISLRSLAEVCITLRYLVHTDTQAMWQSYRVYGAGQAKLAFLKIQQSQGDLPNFLDESVLHAIANEDKWQEYLTIDVGHWANSNLRKLATDCNAKDIYDKYYDWTSGFIHGNWGAVRDTNFVTCHNPLHRLHRIPRVAHRGLNSVEPDAVGLVNNMISVLEHLYPGTEPIPSVALRPPPAI